MKKTVITHIFNWLNFAAITAIIFIPLFFDEYLEVREDITWAIAITAILITAILCAYKLIDSHIHLKNIEVDKKNKHELELMQLKFEQEKEWSQLTIARDIANKMVLSSDEGLKKQNEELKKKQEELNKEKEKAIERAEQYNKQVEVYKDMLKDIQTTITLNK